MRGRRGARWAMVLAGVLVLAACSGREPNLINTNRGQVGPDEFGVLPNRPIEIPQDLSALPPPTPGARNRVDPQPQADAVAALGGQPARLERTGDLRGEAGLIGHTTRYGVQSGVREDLAAEDLEFRRRNRGRVLERLFGVSTYWRAYEREELDQYRELERYRAAGARNPAAPPPEE